ncbi:MAG: glycosyltransferase [Bacteroidota bacterium]
MKVLQLIDSLEVGGAERMSVSLANELAHQKMDSFLCATREEGPLKASLNKEVGFLFLKKKKAYDLLALKRLYQWVKRYDIEIIHAHSSSFFFAYLIKLLRPKTILIWHDHYGNSEALDQRKDKVLRYCSGKFDAIIAVNTRLKDWAEERLHCARVYYVANFVSELSQEQPSAHTKGTADINIVCLANIRPQKDHANLLNAMALVQEQFPDCAVHLIGKITEGDYYDGLVEQIEKKAIQNVYFYGAQTGILPWLKTFDIGVLSSKSEGLPVALLEYGIAGLPVVCTAVGQIPQVIGNAGLIVPPNDVEALANAILHYIRRSEDRSVKALDFQHRVRASYSVQSAVSKLMEIYKH